ncbi:MAG: hypothetical protein ACFFE8_11585 [Candidatus Heimdallarchaeota archaeon]
MFQQQPIYIRKRKDSESIIEYELFFKDLIDYLETIRRFIPKDVNEINLVCKRLYTDYTKPFYSKWANLNLITWNSEYEQNYHSFLLEYLSTKILLPHRFLIYLNLQPETGIIDELKKAKSPNSFFFILNKIQRVLNLPLLRNDVRIIETLTNQLIKDKIPVFPSNRQLARLIRCSENTISRRINFLTNRAMFTQKYRVDLAKLGYNSFAIIHKEQFENLPPSIEPFCLADIPIDWGERVAKIKIFQIPYTKKILLSGIREFYRPVYEITLTKSYLGWNLSGLKPVIADRWKIYPPIFNGEQWSDIVLSQYNGIEQNLFNDLTAIRISKVQAKMLDLLQIEALTNKHISKTLGLTPKYVQEYFELFIEKELISRFLQIGHMGLDSKVWITLIGSEGNNDYNLLTNIVEHLKFFPFSWLFYNENKMDAGTRPLLAGLLWFPSSWFVDFYGIWIQLINHGFIPKVNMRQGVIKWNIEIGKTYDFANTNHWLVTNR